MAENHLTEIEGFVLQPMPTNHPAFKNLMGQRFTRMLVIGYLGNTYWLCRCDCGVVKRCSRTCLLRGETKSCGCKRVDNNRREWEPIDNGDGTIGIPLNQNLVAIIDAADLPLVQDFTWTAWKPPHATSHYVKHTNPKRKIVLHRLIAGAKEGQHVDHRNGNALDNRRCNLRICTIAQNVRNTPKRKTNTSGYKGVIKRSLKDGSFSWTAIIRKDGKMTNLGSYRTAEDAARAYDAEAKNLHGEFAHLNFPEVD